MRTGLVIPTLNAAQLLPNLLREINEAGKFLTRKVIVDSSSEDATADIAKKCGFEVLTIARKDFNHGGTRQLAAAHIKDDVDVVIFATQDIRLKDDKALKKLAEVFADDEVGAAYGRQLPKGDASPMAALLRKFNYPPASAKKTMADKERYGLKTAFMSDSFGAYRMTALEEAGGFPPCVRCSEDMYVAAKMLLKGWAIYYNAEAEVYHSHEFDLKSAWRRYRDVGAFQKKESWIGETFGKAEGEGLKLLKMQLKEAAETGGAPLAARIILDDAVKFLAYRYGGIFG